MRTVFIYLTEPEGIWVFWEYLCVGDSWAELYKLTLVSITSGLNQIPLLRIEDMSTDTASSGVIIYQPSSATLDLKTFLHHVNLIHTVYVVYNDVFHQNHTEAFNLTPKWPNLQLFPAVASLFVCVGQVFAAFSNPLIQNNHQGKKKKKAKPLADCWSMTQLWKSPPPNQIVRLQGGEVPAPGHAVSLTSFEGLMHIFLSCQGRVMGAKEYRGAQRSLLSKYQEPLKYLIVL